MSAEDTGQPPTEGADKAQPAKPAVAFTSSFINKNTTGKKFAPKAARRRPGAAPAAAAPKPAAPAPTPPVVEAQTEPESSNAPSEVTPAHQLPTPAATQEPSTQHVEQSTPSVLETPTTARAETPSNTTIPTTTEPLPTPPSTSTAPPVTGAFPTATSPASQPIEAVHDEAEAGRAAKRHRMEPPAPKSNATPDTVVDVPTTEPAQSAQPEMEAPVQPSPETSVSGVLEQVPEPTSGAQSVNTNSAGPAPEVPGAMRPRKRRTLPWNAVNLPQEVEEEEVAPAPVKKTRKPPKTRGRKDATTISEEQEAGQEGVEGDEAQQVRKRPSAKARGKRKADAAVNEDGTEAPAPAKRARKPRKVKSKEAVTDADAGEGAEAVEGEADAQAEEGGEPVVRRKSRVPRAPRRKKRSSTEVEGEDGQDPAQPKRKGRPPREPTPEDAEEQEIDPEVTYMDSIASRNIRVGKLSAREKAMREIDWEAVKQRRREEDSRKIDSRAQIEAAEKLQIETAPQIDGPRYIIVDGQIQLQHNSTTINPEADADREIENYEVIEERDLTTRITSRSFLKNNKRFPNDFILPGQGKRWTAADTELFYEGLQHFGTDFQMISHMFPGSTRRSMKLKFTREERDNPARIREILLSRSTIVSHWDNFMQVSQLDEEKFANADAIKQEMADEEADFRARIEAAKAETAERKRQQKEAGLLDNEDENGNPIDKENAKGKKKRKGKEKQVAFAEDDGVEILGNVDDDDTWGQE